MSENATAPAPEPESESVKVNRPSSNVQREVVNVIKFLDIADGKEVANVGLILTNVLSSYGKKMQDYAPRAGVGKVIKWFPTRGFGFIQSEDSSEDLFAHMTEIQGKFNALSIGKTVSFTRAFNIKRGKFQATKVSGEGCIRTKYGRPRANFDYQKGMSVRGPNYRFNHNRNRGRGGRGRGYNRRGRGRGRYNGNPYAYNYGGGMYGMSYGNGYGMGGYGGYPMMGYGGGMGYPPFPYYSGPGAAYGGSQRSYGMYNGRNDGPAAAGSQMPNGETSPGPPSPNNGPPMSFAGSYGGPGVQDGGATPPSGEAPRSPYDMGP